MSTASRVFFFLFSFCVLGCPRREEKTLPVALGDGVTFVEDSKNGVQLLSINQAEADVVPVVVARGVTKMGGNHVGEVKTVKEWVEEKQAIAGINANFFGETYEGGKKKQIIQMAMVNGKVVAPASITITDTSQEYRRCAVGFDKKGTPSLAWASGETPVMSWERPVDATESTIWPVHNAASCGPRLIQEGRRMITAQAERLVSRGQLGRAFVAFDDQKHLVLGRADAMRYEDITNYLRAYFQENFHTLPQEAMCLDGGPSAQIAYRDASGNYVDAHPTGVTVPVAILLVPR
jgi:exopolysaccharide biosynthesis protein